LTRLEAVSHIEQDLLGLAKIEQDLQSWTGLAKLPRQRQQLTWQDQAETNTWSVPMYAQKVCALEVQVLVCFGLCMLSISSV